MNLLHTTEIVENSKKTSARFRGITTIKLSSHKILIKIATKEERVNFCKT